MTIRIVSTRSPHSDRFCFCSCSYGIPCLFGVIIPLATITKHRKCYSGIIISLLPRIICTSYRSDTIYCLPFSVGIRCRTRRQTHTIPNRRQIIPQRRCNRCDCHYSRHYAGCKSLKSHNFIPLSL